MDIEGITFRKTISFINIIYSTIGYPPCNEFRQKTWMGRVKRYWAFIPIYILGIIMTLNTFLYVVMKVRESVSIWDILSQAVVWTYFTNAFMKMFIVLNNRDELASLIEILRSIWPRTVNTSVEKQFVEHYMTSNIKWMSRYAYLSIACFFIVNTTPLFVMLFKVLTDDKAERILPFLTWFPFDEYDKMTYPLCYIYLFYGSHIGSASQICYDSLFCVILSHICMHYKLLGEELRNVVQSTGNCQDPDEAGSEERMRKCIEKHQLLIEIRCKMEDIFTDMIFINFLISSINICIVGFLFIMQKGILGKIRLVMMLLTLLAQLLLLCWFGQELMDNSMFISDAVYDCQWYASSQKIRKMVIYMIHHSQIPQKLVAMKFWDITLQSFNSLVSASWSYFALLNTIYGDMSENQLQGGLLT